MTILELRIHWVTPAIYKARMKYYDVDSNIITITPRDEASAAEMRVEIAQQVKRIINRAKYYYVVAEIETDEGNIINRTVVPMTPGGKEHATSR